jgi:hypothetical protein
MGRADESRPLQRMAHGMLRLAALGTLMAMVAHAAAQPLAASAAAQRLRDVTPDAQRTALMQPFTLEARGDWHYTPRRRAGIAWKDMSDAQRSATTELLRTALTESGLDKVRAVMALEIALRELETFGLQRDPENYAVALYGEPGSNGKAWGWRIEGHHLSLHWTLQGDRYVATLPQFFGANPARVPRDFGKVVRGGTRVLGAEEDQARALLQSLTAQQRSQAIFDSRPYGDIVTRNAVRALPPDSHGVPFASLSATQQAQLLTLITSFAEHLRPELLQARLTRVRANDGLQTLRFGWAGASEPGQPFYFRVQGAAFLIEYDNSGGNHVHSVWRDFDGDWGRDVLAEHYRSAGPGHRHGSK